MKHRKVMVVEDDHLIREAIAEALDEEGFEVVEAANGREALEKLHHEGASLVLLDLMMPVMDGWQFRQAQVQNETLASIPVIVVSAAGRDRIERIDADAYLSKPIDLEELLRYVTEFCPSGDGPA